MKKEKQGISPIRKIIGGIIVLILLSGICVFATQSNMRDVKIELQNGYEITALTNKNTVKEILEENKIVLAEDEKVTPNIDEELPEGTNIKITNKTAQEIQVAKVTDEGAESSIDDLLQSYSSITEKIVAFEEEIPFNTIKKTATSNAEDSENTVNKVLQEGENGLKRTTYKVKYQNDQEINRELISEDIIREPVDRIVQTSKVTSRSSKASRKSSSNANTSSSASSNAEELSDSEESARLWIISKESSGNYSASNGRYYGAYQMDRFRLNGDYSKENQDATANAYVKSRYGSWTNAKKFWLANHYY